MASSNRRRSLGLALVVTIVAVLAAPAATGAERPAGVAASGPRILATGDSMMRYVDDRLRGKLAQSPGVSFRSDVRIGSGLSKDPWVRISRGQVRKHRPRATIVFMGAAEGFTMKGIRCCVEAWIAEYASRVSKLIRIYSRGGRGDVYWVTLPAARDPLRARVFRAVNRAMRRAVPTSGSHAHLVDAWAVMTPRGRYRRTMMWRGNRIVARARDGAHLSGHGTAVPASLVIDAMRRDGIIP